MVRITKMKKIWDFIFLPWFHMCTTLSCSNEPSNYYNSFSNSRSFSINSTKLKSDLKSTLGSLGQFLHININSSKLVVCKWHVLKYINMLIIKKMLFEILLCLIFWQAKKPIVGNIDLYFSQHQKGHLISLIFTWRLLKICNVLPTSSSTSSWVLIVCSKISKLQFLTIRFAQPSLHFDAWCKWSCIW